MMLTDKITYSKKGDLNKHLKYRLFRRKGFVLHYSQRKNLLTHAKANVPTECKVFEIICNIAN